MYLIADNGHERVKVVYDVVHAGHEQTPFLPENAAAQWLNKHVAQDLAAQKLETFLSSRKNKENDWHLVLPPQPLPTPEAAEIVGVSGCQQSVYFYDGLYWFTTAKVEQYSILDYPEPQREFRPVRLAIKLPKFELLNEPWMLFHGTLEKHLPPDLIGYHELPEPIIGKL